MKIVTGIASTTHRDLHGDIMAKSALNGMANQINDHYIPLDINHQGTYIGVILVAKVKTLDDGEHGLYVVVGIFENKREYKKYPYKNKNNDYLSYIHLLNGG
ncbi:MAG: hypothetical protein KJ864_01100 [Candidatus Omnitrophica bacterium]|nr:hypothetical protein [Candidatus Omnitrophota bacterium]